MCNHKLRIIIIIMSELRWVCNRHQGRSRRHSRSFMQTECRQNNSPPRLERPRVASDWPQQRTCSQETSGSPAGMKMDWRRCHGRLANVRPLTSQLKTPLLSRIYLPRHQPLEPPLKVQQTGKSWNTSPFIPLAYETLGPINSKCTDFLN